MRRFRIKRILIVSGLLVLLLSAAALVAAYVYLNSPEFNERLRSFVVEKAAEYTGTRVSLSAFRWNLRTQRIVLEDLTLHGTEPDTEPPLAHIGSIKAGLRLRSLLQRRIDLFELEIVDPELRLRVDDKGKTNLPGPVRKPDLGDSRLTVAIDSFKVVNGRAIINELKTPVNFDIKDLLADLTYRSETETLSANVSYGGILQKPGGFSIPYSLASEFDFTQGTLVAKNVEISSGKSSAKLQGRIDRALTSEIAAKLAYTAKFDGVFLKHFFPKENVIGTVTTDGMLDFSSGRFATNGDLASPGVEYLGWNAKAIKAAYSYSYPEKKLQLRKVNASALDGKSQGAITVSDLPGNPRVTLDMDYDDIDATRLAGLYPWNPKYIVYSKARGRIAGWFEGKLDRYEFEGDSVLSPAQPPSVSTIVPLPAEGTVAFAIRPGQANILSADLRLHDTLIRTKGTVIGKSADLDLDVVSENLANLNFIYPDANGKGTFKGTLKGPIEKPALDGRFSADQYKFREWTIRHAEGQAKLDMQTELAELTDVTVLIGQSAARVDGTTNLAGTTVSLRVQSDALHPEDFASLLPEKVGGVFSGNVTVTSINPLRVSGRVSGVGVTARGQTLDSFSGDVTYNDPIIVVRNLTANELGATLKADSLEFNRSTEVINVTADVSSLAFNKLRELGVPETLGGTIRDAHITVTGKQSEPKIEGTATIENLTFRSETFPVARLQLSTNWPILAVTVTEIPNVNLTADVNLSSSSYPFKATARFADYPVEQLANFSGGTLTATGAATFEGDLKGQSPLSGKGTISSIQALIKEYSFQGAKPFPFEFDANRLTLTEGASFNGAYSTFITLKGSIGLTNSPPLDLRVTGKLDLSEVTAAYDLWSVTGIVTVDGQIGGTATRPTISGNANIQNGSLGHEGVYTTLAGLAGDIRFKENRITFDNLEGRVGGGTVRLQGSGLIQNSRIEGLNVRIDTEQVRLRYPAGLRSSITGGLLLRGTTDSPSLEGNLRLDSITYRSEFEAFLSAFRPGGLNSGGTRFDNLRLALHVAGNRNITVQNELTDISGARVDLDIKGTFGNPTLTGHIEATDGTLLFQNKRYDITRGNIDFVDPLRIEPVVDIQAETDVRDYRVFLIVAGKGDRITVDFRSDPPLPRLEIISLIGGGKTRDELERARQESGQPGNASLPTSEELFQGGAVSILTDILRSRVGNRFGLMGLDWIRVDLPVETANSNPSLRVTLSQQVSKDLSVTYSQDLATSQQRLILIEYFLTKNLSIVASREETNETSALGLDVKLRTRF